MSRRERARRERHSAHCNRDNYDITQCRNFAREPAERRRLIVDCKSLCYVCLGRGYYQRQCSYLVARCKANVEGERDMSLLPRLQDPI